MTLFDRVFSGSNEMYAWAEKSVAEALEKYGADAAVSLPSTAYSLPCYYAVTGEKLTTLGEVKAALEGRIKEMMTRKERLHNVFQSGIATALAAEIIETMKYMDGAAPYEEPYVGHFTDAMIRELGVPLVTGDIPGVPVIINAAPSVEEAVALVKSYQAQGNFVTCVGGICDQLIEAGYNTGFNVRVTLMGKDITSAAHVVSIALRAALIFGNITPGDLPNLMKYTFERVFAFVNAFAPVDDLTVGCGAGAIAFGFPVISNDLESLKGMNVPKSLILQGDTEKFNPTSIEARDVKIKVTDIDIPVAFASAFEGEIIRKGDMQVEFDGSRKDCFELVQTKIDHLNNTVQENLVAVRVVKAFVRAGYEKTKFKKANEDLTQTGITVALRINLISPLMTIVLNLVTLTVLYLGGSQVMEGTMLYGDLSSFISYIAQILMSVMMAGMVFIMSSRAAAPVSRRDASGGARRRPGRSPASIWARVWSPFSCQDRRILSM